MNPEQRTAAMELERTSLLARLEAAHAQVAAAEKRNTEDRAACLVVIEEARDLARSLYAAARENCEYWSEVSAYDAELTHERLPEWLTRETGAPEIWQRGDDKTESEA